MLLHLLIVLLGIRLTNAFYLPGVAPTSYGKDEQVPLFVNHITPSIKHDDSKAKTYVYSYDYYLPRFHFCLPEHGPQKQPESLGSIMFGDRIFNSPFDIKMLQNQSCAEMCSAVYSRTDAVFVNRNIRSGFMHNWLIDGLPVARNWLDKKTNSEFYGAGFDLGFVDQDEKVHLYNHFEIVVEYHQRAENEFRIVGATLNPASLQKNSKSQACQLKDAKPVDLSQDKSTDVSFSYSVVFVPSKTVWATRWDKYLHVYDPKIQWFSLVNFSVIVLFLSLMMAHILIRALKSDIQKYNEVDLDEDVVDEMGWKLVHGDIFRSPKNKLLLSILVGSGSQILLMALSTTGFALLGLLSPSNRGSLSTVMFILYALFGSVGSFVSSSVYKLFGGESWKLNTLLSPLLVPGSLFAMFLLLNFFLISVKSSGAVPVGTMFAIVFIWFIVSVPLSVAGSLVGFRKTAVTLPVKTNQIPRQIPAQPWYLKTVILSLIAGIFPFGSIAIEMYFIYTSLWFNRIYYMFGFLFFCFLLMLLTTLLVTVLLNYYTLCNENYKWQWRSFFIGGGLSVYVFLHAILLSKFELGGPVSIVLYVGYSLMISAVMGIMCGAVGFIGVLLFVHRIYSQIKID